jgi:hypothetical protein
MPVAKDVHHHTDLTAPQRDVQPGVADETIVGVVTAPVSRETDADAHLLRLCLDLQLDAMLLALGAAAARPGGADAPPWGRWVTEDVHMARVLATDVINGGAALPPTLGSDLDHAVPAAAVDNLTARYESMENLLTDVVRSGNFEESFPHRGHVEEALRRCRDRLSELRARRLDETPPRGLALGQHVAPHAALPGEWLG